jgi:predicted methyltransferase
MRTALLVALLVAAFACGPRTPPAVPLSGDTTSKLAQAVAGSWRPESESARDRYRHPVETLQFFGLRDDMTVVELFPGGGWYTAILAPVLAGRGKLACAPAGDDLRRRLASSPFFARVEARDFASLGPDGSADMVVTFRNVHNWIGQHTEAAVFARAFAVVKSGGILGVEEHRAPPGADPAQAPATGYVPEAYVVQLAETAGFKLAGRSEINDNPRDTKDYPKGVWTLPPSYDLGEKDHAKYEAIGESDRMTLKFVKP